MARSVLITGTSTGIGRACAAQLARAGWRVFAGVRREADAESLRAEIPSVEPMFIDMAEDASIARAVAEVESRLGGDGLAGLVNNAGIAVPGPVEFLTRDDWRHQFEVNLFGPVELIRRALPLLRRHVAKAGPGSAGIVLIGSIGGRVSQPMIAPYTSSKHALASMGESLRHELRRQGIGVSTVEPGAIDTAIWGKAQAGSDRFAGHEAARSLYGPEIGGVAEAARQAAASAIPPDAVARVVERCLNATPPPARTVVGRQAKGAALFKWLLPYSIFERLVAGRMRMPAGGGGPI